MTLEDLKRHNAGVAKHVTGNASMENLQRPIVTCVCEELIATTGMEFDGADGLTVVPQCLVGALREFEVVPQETTVVGSHDQVISASRSRRSRVNIEGRNPAGTRLDDFDEKLAGEIVRTHCPLVCDEQDRLRGVEVGGLWCSTTLYTSAEGELGQMLGEGMDGDSN